MTILTLSLVFLAIADPSMAISCPSTCHCLRLGRFNRVECHWSRVLKESLLGLPADKISELILHCTSKEAASDIDRGAFEKFTNLAQLTIDNCYAPNGRVPKETFTGLASLKRLTMTSCGGDRDGLTFDPSAFKPLTHVEQLTIVNSRLRELPRKALCGMPLQTLNMSGNFIQDVNDTGILGCTNSLIVFDLSRNLLSSIKRKTFSEMRLVHRLYLNGNVLDHLAESDVFEGLTMVELIDLSKNRLAIFDQDLRISTPRLEELRLGFNKLSKFEARLGLLPKDLKILDLSNNNAVFDNEFTLDGQSLVNLDLSHNQIQRFESSYIRNAPSLTTIELHHNKMKELNLASFKSAPKLENLDLHRNEISLWLASDTKLPNLKRLSLDDNLMSTCKFLEQVPRLRELNLAKNKFTILETCLAIVKTSLEKLELQENSLVQIHGFFLDVFEELKFLNLSGNYISSLDTYSVQKIRKLEIVDLSHNRIREIETNAFYGMPNLAEIRLQGNQVKKLSTNMFSSVDSLSSLNLSSNSLASIDMSFFSAHLRTLDLSNNDIAEFTKFTEHEMALEELNLANNKLSTLSYNAFPSNLVTLDLSENEILEVNSSGFLASKPSLKLVDLSNNKIEQISEETVKTKNSETVLKIGGNPLKCSCANLWLKKLPGTSYPSVENYRTLECQSPLNPGYPDQLVTNVPLTDFLCPYKEMAYNPCPCKRFGVCDCVSQCPAGCRCFSNADMTEDVIDCRQSIKRVEISRIPFYSTRWYLDGAPNVAKVVPKLYRRGRLREVYLNSTRFAAIEPQAFINLKSLQFVNLSDNALLSIPGDAFQKLPNLTYLALAKNRLERLPDQVFDEGLPSLKVVDLSNNQFRRLPEAVKNGKFRVLLGNNPWKCDCGDKYEIPRWLKENYRRVPDAQSIYCYEDAQVNTTNATVLSTLIPAGSNDSFKMNMLYFTRIHDKLCTPGAEPPIIDPSEPYPFTPSSKAILTPPIPDELETAVNAYTRKQETIIYIVVGISTGILTVFIIVAICFFKSTIREKLLGNAHQKIYKVPFTTAGEMSPVSSANASLYIPPPSSAGDPLLTYDAFVACSSVNADFVTEYIATPLEQELPYYQLCLLYRDVYNVHHTLSRNHVIDDLVMESMAKCQRILIVLTETFLQEEWESAQIRAALHYVAKDRRRRLIFVLLDDIRFDQIDSVLGQYLRTSVCIQFSDPLFWEKLRDAFPDKVLNSLNDSHSTSSAYYGTIVPSEFV